MNFDAYQPLQGIRANFICTQVGAYQVAGSSRPIGNEEDRRLLIHLRSLADAVIVGGSTARNEGYIHSNRFETYVFTKKPDSIPEGLKPISFSEGHPLRQVLTSIGQIHPRVLVEAGPSLLSKMLREGLIDQLCLTISGTEGSPAKIAERVFNLPNLGEPSEMQCVGHYRFCIWNL